MLTYYLTLPKWAREHSLVTNVFYAMEYHQTRMNIRDKELALNFAASFLRPIDKRLMDCVKEVAAAKKIRLNVEVGKQMMNEIRFWAMDVHDIGELSEDELQEDEKKLMQLLTQGSLDDDEEDKLSLAERMF